MTKPYRITPRAYEDLKNIGRYTLKMWGKKQRNHYLKAMERRFEWLAEQPEVGRHRPDVEEGYFSYIQGSHVIFYLMRDGGIDIIGIPHQHMDVVNYPIRPVGNERECCNNGWKNNGGNPKPVLNASICVF